MNLFRRPNYVYMPEMSRLHGNLADLHDFVGNTRNLKATYMTKKAICPLLKAVYTISGKTAYMTSEAARTV